MKTLLEIKDSDLNLETIDVLHYKKREAARAIIFNAEAKIALLNVGLHSYHKLPGGGMDPNESFEDAVQREAIEEVGAVITLRDIKLGKIIEHRQQHSLHQISYCGIADLKGDLQEMQREKDEIEKQQLPIWVTLNEAIDLINNDDTDDYQGKFIKIRDLAFLKAAKEFLS